MSANTFGHSFRATTFGESHGPAIGVVVDGVPPGLELSEADIQKELDRRRPGQSTVATPRRESDKVEILSGIFEGRTMGPPVAMLIRNRNQDPSAYREIKDKLRPGHADFSYLARYGMRDWRGSGRASGRETAGRVAAGAVAKKILAERNISVVAFAREIADICANAVEYEQIEQNMVRTADPRSAEAMIARIEEAKAAGNSVGGIVELHINGVPAGWGNPVFDKLEAVLAHAIMSIGAVKGIAFGVGFDAAHMNGSEYNDEFYMQGARVRTRSNNCGGILGGISTGEQIVARAVVRPTASIAATQSTVTMNGRETTIQTHGRHDPCIVPRVIPVVEAMAALTLVDTMLQQKAKTEPCG